MSRNYSYIITVIRDLTCQKAPHHIGLRVKPAARRFIRRITGDCARKSGNPSLDLKHHPRSILPGVDSSTILDARNPQIPDLSGYGALARWSRAPTGTVRTRGGHEDLCACDAQAGEIA
jgi:hypothetical protein